MLATIRTRVWSRAFRQSSALRAAAADAADSSKGASAIPKLKLNFNVPYQAIVKNEDVHIVTIPGTEGEFGVLAGHVPIITELQPGVVTVDYGDGKELKKFFVSGGFAFVHANSVTDIAAAEAVAVEDLDPNAIQKNLQEAEAALSSATDPKEKAIAQIAVDVNKKLAAVASSK